MLSLLNKSRAGLVRSLIGGSSPIGLDVGSANIRAVQLVRAPTTAESEIPYRLGAAAQAKRAGDPPSEPGPPVGLDQGAVGELASVLDRGGFKGRNVVMGLDPPNLVATAVSLPLNDKPLEDPQIRSALSFELSRHCGYDPEEAEIRAWRLPEGGPLAPTVMGVAARRNLVAEHYAATASAGYSCRRIDAGACALVRCCSVFCAPPHDSIWGVLDMGSLATRLVVAVNGIPVLQRELPCGGAILSFRVAEHLKLSPQAAERLKIDHGIVGGQPQAGGARLSETTAPAHDSSEGASDEKDALPAESLPSHMQVSRLIFAAVRRSLAGMAVEVEKSLAYAMHLHGDLPVSTLYLTGGGAALRGLDSFLSREIGIEVAPADPLRILGVRPMVSHGEPGMAWVRAVGLALLGESG